MSELGFRERLAGDLEARYDQLVGMLDEALAAEVVVRSTDPCPKGCGCQHHRTVRVPDFKVKLQIAEFFANQGFGRPGLAADDSVVERVVLNRSVVYSGEAADDV